MGSGQTTMATAVRKRASDGYKVHFKVVGQDPKFPNGEELAIESPFRARVSLTQLGMESQEYVLSAAISPIIAHQLHESVEPVTGQIRFPQLRVSPLITYSLYPRLKDGGWKAEFLFGEQKLLAEVTGDKLSRQALKYWRKVI